MIDGMAGTGAERQYAYGGTKEEWPWTDPVLPTISPPPRSHRGTAPRAPGRGQREQGSTIRPAEARACRHCARPLPIAQNLGAVELHSAQALAFIGKLMQSPLLANATTPRNSCAR